MLPLALTSAALLFTSAAVQAADRSWDGGGDNEFWKTAANWAGNVAPAAGDSLYFIGTERTGNTNDFISGTLFDSLTFGTGGNAAGEFSIGGNGITLGSGITNNQVVTPQTLLLPITLSATRTVDVVDSAYLTLDGVLSGAGGLTKEGAGQLTLSGANMFSGALAVNDGTVSISSDSNLGAVPGGATPGSVVLDGGTLNVSEDFTIEANRGIAVGNGGGGDGRIDTDNGVSLAYGGAIAGNGGAGGFTKGKFGELTLSGANTYSGPTAIKVGSINLDFTAGGTSDIINGVSTLQLGGENSDLGDQSFAAIVMDGADGEANTQTFNGTSLDIGTSRIVANSGTGGSATLNLGLLTHTSGGNVTILLPNDGAINTTSPNVNSILGGFAMVSDGSTANNILAGVNYATVDGSGNILAYSNYTVWSGSGTISDVSGTGVNFRIDDSTSGDLAVAPDDTGVIELNTLNLNQTASGRGNQNFSIVVGTNNTLRMGSFGGISRSDDTPNSAPGGDLTWALGTSSGGANGIQNDGTLTAGGADNTPGEIVFSLNNRNQSSGSLNVEVQITDNGTAPVTIVKSGRGSMKFRGHNTYSGGTYIMQGRFQLAGSEIGTGNPDGWGTGPVYIFPGAQAFPSGIGGGNAFTNEMFLSGVGTDQENTGAIRMGSGAEFAGPINLFGDTQLGGGGGGAASSGGAIISGKISGGFSLAFGSRHNTGGGHSVAILTNPDNDWTGDTQVVGRNNGVGNSRLVLGADDVIPNGFGYGNMIVGLEDITAGSTTTLDLNGHNETVNGLLSEGDLANVFVENNGITNATLTVGDNNVSSTFAGILRDGIGLVNTLGGGGSSPLGLTKIGGGSLTLSGANTHTGPTTVNAGALAVSGSGTISSSPIQVNSGATFDVSKASSFTTFSPIGVNQGTFAVSSTGLGGIVDLSLTNGHVRVNGLSEITPNVEATTLTAAGATNYIDVQSIGFISGYPAQFPVIKYTSLMGSANFGLGSVPRSDTVGYVTNNTANGSIDLVLLDGPKALTWKGNNGNVWDNNLTTNWLAFGSTPAVFQSLDAVLFDDSATSGTVDVDGTIIPSTMIVNNPTLNYVFEGGGILAGLGGLLKDGAGTLTIANEGMNSFSGGIVLSNGTLQVGNNGTAGNLPNGPVENNTSLVFSRSDTLDEDLNIAGMGTVTQDGSGVTALNGVSTYSGLTTVAQGTLRAGSGSAFGTVGEFDIDPGVVVADGATLDVGGQNLTGEPVVVQGSGVGGNGAIINSGADQLNAVLDVTLANHTTFGGTTRWDIRGTAAVLSTGGNAYNLTKVGANQVSLVGVAVDFALADIAVQEGVFSVETSTTLGASANTLTVSAGATLQLFDCTGILDKHFVLNGDGAAITLNVQEGDADTENNISGPIVLNGNVIIDHDDSADRADLQGAISGTGSLTKSGPSGSMLYLSDTFGAGLTYSGGTVVSGGTLVVEKAITGGGSLSNAAGTLITGKGGNTGPMQIGGSIEPNRAGISGTFTSGSLTLEDSALLTMDVGQNDDSFIITSDQIAVTGSLTVNGVADIQLVPGVVGNVTNGQVITLISYTTGGAPSSNSFNLLPVPTGYAFTLKDPATTPNAIQVTVDKAPAILTWAGTDATNPTFWDTTTVNWTKAGGGSSLYGNGDKVVFDNSSSTRTVSLVGDLEPDSVNMEHSPGMPYTFTGAGKLTGAASLNLGYIGGTLIVANSGNNDFTGPIYVSSGELHVGNGGTTGNLGPGALTNDTVLVLNRSDNGLDVGNVISGAGTITNLGTGVVTLSGDNDPSFQGMIVVSKGTLLAGNADALGDSFSPTIIEPGATLDVNSQDLGLEPVIVSGTGVGGTGAINNSGSGETSALEDVTLAGNTTFGADNRWDIRQQNGPPSQLSTGGNAYNLTKIGSSQVSLVNIEVDPALADVDIQEGILGFEASTSSMGNTNNTLTVRAGAQLMFWNTVGDMTKNFVLIGDGATETIRAGSGQRGDNENFMTGSSPIQLVDAVWLAADGGDDLTILTELSGSGSVEIRDDGGVWLEGINTYTGDTYVQNGSLHLVNDASITTSTNVTINGGAALNVEDRTDGTFTLNGAIGQRLRGDGDLQGVLDATQAGAEIEPGVDMPPGSVDTDSLNVTGTITMGAGTTTYMQVNAPSGDLNDELTTDASITYGGTLNISNVGASLVSGQSFKLFTAASYSGSFGSIVPATPDGNPNLFWITDQLTVDGSLSVGGVQIGYPLVTGGNLEFNGSGGTPDGDYYVLCSTNVALPIASWTPVQTNKFDINGGFSVTLPIGSDPTAFYLLQIP